MFSPQGVATSSWPGMSYRQWLIGMIASGMASNDGWAEALTCADNEIANRMRDDFSLAAIKQTDSILETELQHI